MKNFILFIIFGLMVGLFVKIFLLEVFTVPTDSMLPTIPVGKKVTVIKFFTTLEKNNIIAFEKDSENFVKRIKGLPHDTVGFQNNRRWTMDTGLTDNFSNSVSQLSTVYYIIPQKNDEVRLTNENMSFYQKIIERNENTFITQLGDKIFINGLETNNYTFKQNYYFVQGDNTASSIDSRDFGLIAKKQIFGKVLNIN